MSTEKKSEIKINVSLDENNIPVKMNWSATEAGMDNQECKSMMLSVWDGKDQIALRIDLWTKEMSIEEMKIFFHQTLMTMADTFEKATGEKNICEDMRDYCMHFAEKMKII
jgi:gliding motility-associated protein GldC